MKKFVSTLISIVSGSIALLAIVIPLYKRDKQTRLNHLKSQMQTFESDTGKIEYQVVGVGRPVLVFHGILGSFEHAINAMWQLDQNRYQLIAISRVGYNLTLEQNRLQTDQYLDTVADLLDHLDLQQVAVIAMSAGGPTGIEFAVRHHDKVEKLILLSAVTKSFNYSRLNILTSSEWLMRAIDSDIVAWGITKGIVKSLPLIGVFSSKTQERILKHPDRRQIYAKITHSFFPIEFMSDGYQYDINHIRDLESLAFSKIVCPTLILHGIEDEVVPMEHSLYAHKQIPNSQLVIIDEQADHDFHITHPDAVWTAITEFLNLQE